MGRRNQAEHDLVAYGEIAHAVNDDDVLEMKALAGLLHDFPERLFGHAGIVLERHLRNGRAVVPVSHDAHEGNDCPCGGTCLAHACDFGVNGKVLRAHPDGG